MATLKKLSGFLDASIGSLSAASVEANASSAISNGTSTNDDTPASAILSDLHSLFTLLSKETTNLSLAFAPPKEHWDAVDATAKKLNDLSSKIVYGLSVLRQQSTTEDVTEHILAKQWRLASITVFERLMELSNACFSIYNSLGNETIASTQRKQILTNTSLVWKAVERTEKLPKDDRTAFVIAWKETMDTFQDALEEIEALSRKEAKGKARAENQDEVSDDDEDGDEDDFDFDDLEDDGPISEEELKIVQAAYQYMKLVKALLRKTGTVQDDYIPYGRLAEFGNRIASSQDELASALHPPQEVSVIRNELQTYCGVTSILIESVMDAQPATDLAKKLETASLEEGSNSGAARSPSDTEKWFSLCQQHLQKASSTVLALCEDGPER